MRTVPDDLAKRYEAEGWWTQDTIGDLLARGLAAAPEAEFRVHSAARPWSGTFADVDHLARRPAAGLKRRGVGPGDVVAFQLPNWVEAAVVFWAAAFLGAVVIIDLVEREKVTVLPGPPTVYRELLKARRAGGRDLSTLRVAVTGAADILVELIRQIRQELPFTSIMTGYGLTEAGTITASRQTDSFEDIATTVGTACDGFEMRIAEDGELLARATA